MKMLNNSYKNKLLLINQCTRKDNGWFVHVNRIAGRRVNGWFEITEDIEIHDGEGCKITTEELEEKGYCWAVLYCKDDYKPGDIMHLSVMKFV